MGKDWIALMQRQNQLAAIVKTNSASEKYGLTLTEEDAKLILEERTNTLKEQKRVEFGKGIAERIIYEFCDSEYIDQNHYVNTIIRLQEIFYLYKNEMEDEITDDELLHFMKEQFETVCLGDLDYLEGTCLEIFAKAVRAGYGEFRRTEGRGIYTALDDRKRWDYDLYQEVLKELFWR